MEKVPAFSEPIYVTRPQLPDRGKMNGMLDQIWDSRQLTNCGSVARALEGELGQIFAPRAVSVVSSGHAALEAAITALGLAGEVITTAFTFPSTTHAIVRSGLTPVFCDIAEGTPNIDPDKIEACITERTSAILAVHVYGFPCDVSAIECIAKKYGLKVIYDAAHAFGVRYCDKLLGGFGDVSTYSFHATKIFNSVEGGLVVMEDDLLAIVRQVRNFGYSNVSKSPLLVGSNFKMSELHAAVGLLNLQTLQDQIASRKSLFESYQRHLSDMSGLTLLEPGSEVEWNYAYCPLVLRDAEKVEALIAVLESKNVFARRYFYPLVTEAECYRGRDFYNGHFPLSKILSSQVICLPLYADLEESSVEVIASIIRMFFKRGDG